jgi:hypothetical protein
VSPSDHLAAVAAGGNERREHDAGLGAPWRAPNTRTTRAAPPSLAPGRNITLHESRLSATPEKRAMRRVLSLLSSVAIAALPNLLEAQGSITGTVKDSAAGTPLGGVTVNVVGTVLNATTDAAGQYALATVPAGTYRLRARRLGYAAGDMSGKLPLSSVASMQVNAGSRAKRWQLARRMSAMLA